jgi:4-alpha-glucanotransferase
MVVMQFAWGGGPTNVHLPHMHYDNCFVYPGTHDNETAVGWWAGRCDWMGAGVRVLAVEWWRVVWCGMVWSMIDVTSSPSSSLQC